MWWIQNFQWRLMNHFRDLWKVRPVVWNMPAESKEGLGTCSGVPWRLCLSCSPMSRSNSIVGLLGTVWKYCCLIWIPTFAQNICF
jgi:hypothetical protein